MKLLRWLGSRYACLPVGRWDNFSRLVERWVGARGGCDVIWVGYTFEVNFSFDSFSTRSVFSLLIFQFDSYCSAFFNRSLYKSENNSEC